HADELARHPRGRWCGVGSRLRRDRLALRAHRPRAAPGARPREEATNCAAGHHDTLNRFRPYRWRNIMAHSFSSIVELGDGYGFRKVRQPLGVTAFGVNAIVYPPGFEGFLHYH